MVGIKFFECLICRNLFFNNVKLEKRFIGDRKSVREHLAKYHHINRKAKFYGHMVGKKGNRTFRGKDERSIITRNCVLYKEY